MAGATAVRRGPQVEVGLGAAAGPLPVAGLAYSGRAFRRYGRTAVAEAAGVVLALLIVALFLLRRSAVRRRRG